MLLLYRVPGPSQWNRPSLLLPLLSSPLLASPRLASFALLPVISYIAPFETWVTWAHFLHVRENSGTQVIQLVFKLSTWNLANLRWTTIIVIQIESQRAIPSPPSLLRIPVECLVSSWLGNLFGASVALPLPSPPFSSRRQARPYGYRSPTLLDTLFRTNLYCAHLTPSNITQEKDLRRVPYKQLPRILTYRTGRTASSCRTWPTERYILCWDTSQHWTADKYE